MPSSPVYVLSTRSLSPSLVDAAAAEGVMIDILPFIAVEPLKLGTGKLPAKPLTAVFTSTNAVAALESNLRMALEKNGCRDWTIFCLGGATRRQAAEYFGEGAISGTADSAGELANKIIGQMPAVSASGGPDAKSGGEIWFFCGDRRRDELPDRLRQAGFMVHEIVVYRTVLTPHRIERSYDAIAFFSPSAVESFFSVNTLPPEVPLFAIGGTTAGAIRRRCNNPVKVSERPDEGLLIHQLIKNNQH